VLAAVPAELEYIAWTATAVAMALLTAVFLSYGSARVEVVDAHLQAGRARIPLSMLGEARALDAEAMRRQAGMDADARAYLRRRPNLKRGVRLDVLAPADPVPYWLNSCRRPDRLAAVLESSRVR